MAQAIIEKFFNQHRRTTPTNKEYKELISSLNVYRYAVQVCICTECAAEYVDEKLVRIIDCNKGGEIVYGK